MNKEDFRELDLCRSIVLQYICLGLEVVLVYPNTFEDEENKSTYIESTFNTKSIYFMKDILARKGMQVTALSYDSKNYNKLSLMNGINLINAQKHDRHTFYTLVDSTVFLKMPDGLISTLK